MWKRLGLVVVAGLGLGLAGAAPAQGAGNPVEEFDTSGLPAQPANFTEQLLQERENQIQVEIGRYRPGDLAQAVRIQKALAGYYA